jgi:hypothetical protein
MKTITLSILLAASVAQLKAQQLTPAISPDKQADNSLYLSIRSKPNTGILQSVSIAPQTDQQTTINKSTNIFNQNEAVYSKMPMAKLLSADKMPVAKLGESNTRYTMLVKKYDVTTPGTSDQKINP